jgi:hypothetical protein
MREAAKTVTTAMATHRMLLRLAPGFPEIGIIPQSKALTIGFRKVLAGLSVFPLNQTLTERVRICFLGQRA